MRNLLDFLIKYKHWLLFIFLEVISFVLLFRFNGYQGSVFFTSANVVTGKVYQMANNLTGYFHLKTINSDLVQHNAELSIQLEHLKEAYKKLTADTTVIEQMKQEALMDCRLIKANVINNSTIHANNFITIDKGEADGVQKEMGVVSGSGIVGIVYQTSAHYAVIIPVLNSKSSISCKIRRSDYFGFLKWEGGSPEFAYIKDMPRHSIFEVGDTIVTSGHSAIFPSGVLVGTVDDVGDSNDGLSYSIRVKLFTDFARLNEVRVVERSNIEEQLELEESVVNKER
ncbi:MAG: rod shape-determining protein MreC [Phocaeicola sp.]|nr:rod shape-determining protein MreC [Phocaeicola sp.]MBR1720312.1 rod shape-determining protein MreC [Phocaeicola sp.]